MMISFSASCGFLRSSLKSGLETNPGTKSRSIDLGWQSQRRQRKICTSRVALNQKGGPPLPQQARSLAWNFSPVAIVKNRRQGNIGWHGSRLSAKTADGTADAREISRGG